MKLFLSCLLITFFFISCFQDKTQSNAEGTIEKKEAREDSLALAASYTAQSKIAYSVSPQNETIPIKANNEDDAADDPAIWVNPSDPSKSLIYGSNKKGGLAVFNLDGEEVNYYPMGKINNVDIVYDVPVKDSVITLLGCSNRTKQSIELWKINANGSLQNIAAKDLIVDTKLIDDIYGFCFAVDSASKNIYVVINGKNGLMQQFQLVSSDSGMDIELKKSVQFDTQTEGMVADNENGFLYVGEEGRGIWKLKIDPSIDFAKSFVKNSDISNPNISYDVEGLTLYKEDDSGYLIASSQGNFSYAVFERLGNNKYLGSFKVEGNKNVDGVEETDGLDVVNDSLSPSYPNGIMVMQDGFNFDGDTLRPQNFKYIDWKEIKKVIQTISPNE